ncbi:hypothetical protein MRB53_007481 [Persea americana]|uniref:Uncharacterized protein n=1 Tax=Persea americana TaxID=3435 RepID=A0ACC2MK50_PERAE|nr:hypothetical protein MRB53_007481 [Persea americana]
MGSSGSKKSSEDISELQSYEDACRDDPSIRNFDATLQTRTTEVLSSVVAGIDIRSLSFDSLKEVYGGLLGMNQEVVSIILSDQKDRSMLKKLELHKCKINKKIKSVKTYRKLTGIIFVATVVAVVICSVVAAAVAAPPIAAALAAAASVPLGSMGKWVDSLWKRYQVELEKQGGLLSSMHWRTSITISDLDSIRTLVDKLECIEPNFSVKFGLGRKKRIPAECLSNERALYL